MSADRNSGTQWRSLTVHSDVAERVVASKPYESMSHSEWLDELVEHYEEANQ